MTKPPSRWRMPVGESRLVMACALAVFALFALSQTVRYLSQPDVLYPDFFGLWSFARFVQDHAAIDIYDNSLLRAFQKQIGTGFTDNYPYLYPPPFLLLLWPFGAMPYDFARGAWIVLSLAAILVATCGIRWRRPLAMAAVLAPATTVCLVYGQNGLISAALMVGGVRLARSRPVLAGALFGALIYKPQLGVLIPVALAAAGLWTVLAAAAAAAALIVAASTLCFGWAMWPAWIAAAQAMSGLGQADRAHLDRLMPTVSAAIRRIGGDANLATAAQALAAVAMAVVVWRCWRRGGPLAMDATLPVATFLATPYAFGYDLPVVAAAALLALDDWSRRRATFRFVDLLAVLLVLLLPFVFLSTLSIGAPVAMVLLAILLWRLASTAE